MTDRGTENETRDGRVEKKCTRLHIREGREKGNEVIHMKVTLSERGKSNINYNNMRYMIK